MKASELRIGNWVLYKNGNQRSKIEFVNFEFICRNPSLVESTFEPIPITEEWLLRFGIESDAGGYRLTNTIHLNWCGFENGTFLKAYANWDEIPITDALRHVHQLQNLYFALTGEDLELKE